MSYVRSLPFLGYEDGCVRALHPREQGRPRDAAARRILQNVLVSDQSPSDAYETEKGRPFLLRPWGRADLERRNDGSQLPARVLPREGKGRSRRSLASDR